MAIEVTLHVLLWLAFHLLPGGQATWVVQRSGVPPMAAVRVAGGFDLQPPKGVPGGLLPVRVDGTKITLGPKDKGATVDASSHLRVRAPLTLSSLQDVLCESDKARTCFEQVLLSNDKARLVYRDKAAKQFEFNFQRVGP